MESDLQATLKSMESIVYFQPTASIRFIAEELRRYGIKTNQTNSRGDTVFYQSAHLLQTYDREGEDNVNYCNYALVSFKDLFHIIGKNSDGVDDLDIVRVWVIAEKLEKREIIKILGTVDGPLEPNTRPDLPDVYAPLHHVHRKDEENEKFSYKSKFATNKMYKLDNGNRLYGVSDHFVLV
jgi:hypothetical protein